MGDIVDGLKYFGLSDRDIQVYLKLLSDGPNSIRSLANVMSKNRGSIYESIKKLKQEGLVDYHLKGQKQNFTAEDPEKILALIDRRKKSFQKNYSQVEDSIPQLKSLYSLIKNRPIVKYYEGNDGAKSILQDILVEMDGEENGSYMVYSPSESYIYESYQDFSKDRVNRGIEVRTIGIGEKGDTYGLDQRKSLKTSKVIPTYTFVYSGKIAMISQNPRREIRGVIIEDQYLFETQKLIFDSLWQIL